MTEHITKEYEVSSLPHRATRARYTHEIANTEARIHADLELVKQLVKVCDKTLVDEPTEGSHETRVFDGKYLLEERLERHILAQTEEQEGEQEEGSTDAPKVVDAVRDKCLLILCKPRR